MDPADIANRFDFHVAPNAEKVAQHGSARATIRSAAEVLNDLLPEGREKSLTITKLEEAMFWSNAALARQ